jgi:amino acid permease
VCGFKSVFGETIQLTTVRFQVLYAVINLMAVKWYGETEFWAALGKMLLIIGLIIYTFVAMLGKSFLTRIGSSIY